MTNKEFGQELEKRTKKFAIQVIRLSCKLPSTPEGKVIRNQVTKSGTCVGANYREANRGRSRAEFNSKIKICESESNESIYWLEIIQGLDWISITEINPLIKECNELLALFSTIGKNS